MINTPFALSASGLPLCSLDIMKDAWDRLRQCISPTATMSHYGNNALPILNQVFHFACGSLIHFSSSSPTLPAGQTCSQADPKAISFAILQQQQRAEVNRFLFNVKLQTKPRLLPRNYTSTPPANCLPIVFSILTE